MCPRPALEDAFFAAVRPFPFTGAPLCSSALILDRHISQSGICRWTNSSSLIPRGPTVATKQDGVGAPTKPIALGGYLHTDDDAFLIGHVWIETRDEITASRLFYEKTALCRLLAVCFRKVRFYQISKPPDARRNAQKSRRSSSSR